LKIAIHQPNFLPWLGFFDKMKKSDKFVILDDVQVSVEGYITRNKIRTPSGWSWITVPIGSKMGKINEVAPQITEYWLSEVKKKIDRSYGDKRIGDLKDIKQDIYHLFEFELLYGPTTLADFNSRIITYLALRFGYRMPIIYSSSLEVKGSGTDRLINICKELGADTYLSGVGGKNYMDLREFEKAGIQVEFQQFDHPIYNQKFPGFEPNMSAIDKIFCTGEI
jgi:hypothetical protein